MKSKEGFTIAELLIVIVIIAVLATIVVISYIGITSNAYSSRAKAELSALSKAVSIYYTVNGQYPEDVSRDIPAGITPYINGSSDNWPKGPWPDSVYDYDYFTGSDGKEVVQISIRFCPIDGPLSACKFPNEDWAKDFDIDSSAYWCITGKCRAHPGTPDSYPAYCLNCDH
jgi:general secretion pathway protein G